MVQRIERGTRARTDDAVFESLFRAILKGQLVPGEMLAAQTTLARRFGVSVLTVRLAVHRLEEMGLVEVRSGSATTVLDPNKAIDLRVPQRRLEFAKPGEPFSIAAFEMQVASTLPMLVLAARRIQQHDLTALKELVDALPDVPTTKQLSTFLADFWQIIANATQNKILQHQFRCWARTIQTLDRTNRSRSKGHFRGVPALRRTYQVLLDRLQTKRDPVGYWEMVIESLLDRSGPPPTHTELFEAQRDMRV